MVNFLRYRWLYLLLSAAVIGCGLFSIIKWGFRYSIDFIGGTSLEYQISKKTNQLAIRKIATEKKIDLNRLTLDNNRIIIRSEPLTEKQELEFRRELEKKTKTKITLLKFETVGPVVGKETINKTITASLLAIIGILIYMSFAFKGMNYAIAAIVALFHDFLVVVGCYSLLSKFFGAEFDTLFVTAILTTMSFSVHDTIVIFDKIREYLNEKGRGNIEHYANQALTETMVRSLNNSMTIIFMLLALTLLGGTTIRFFVLALLIGTITGTYSSPFVATPILVWLEERLKKQSR